MSLLETTKSLLQTHQIVPNRLLGQNFTIEPSVFQTMVDHASLCPDDVTLDIGAGLGFLTRFLASRCKKVLAVEADKRLMMILRGQLDDTSKVEVIEGNILRVQVPAFSKIISIPPYQISSQLLPWLFDKHFDCGVMILQKEFANRLVAPAGSREYGWLTVLTYYFMNCELLDNVPRWLFYPSPKVGSVIVRLVPKRPLPFALKDEELFTRLVQTIFTQRNRRVRNAVLPFLQDIYGRKAKKFMKIDDVLPFHDKRVRELAPEDFGELANAFAY